MSIFNFCFSETSTNRQTHGDAGSISNLGGQDTSRALFHFFLKKKGYFLKMKMAILCLLQNLGEQVPPVPPVPTFMQTQTA